MTGSDIRQHFFDFFKSKGHTIVPSAPIVIKDDPTLMFTNAGMNQFKDYFLGNKKPQHTRVADTQKCLRVSGKHNDLEEVGVDTYHHTMFEMLGNWSFGDPESPDGIGTGYFKEEAIAWSWELLTEVYKIDKNKLYVTVFEGDEKENLPRDEEAINFWKMCLSDSGFTEAEIKDRIIMGNKKDNFWEMGDTGPCGPCTEIHVDSRTDEERKSVDGKSLVNNDHPQVIEIWNNVFIQYNRKKDGSLEPLPAKHVDTGMGFERLVRVLQNKQSNYDIDVFTGTIAEVEKLSGKKYNPDAKNPSSQQSSHNSPSTGGGWGEAVAFRVIADHIRAIAFPIADGQLPSNTGAGYVIRRILRRAVRYYFSYLDVKQPLLYKLIPVLAEQFENVFPELDKQKDFIRKVIHEEEQNFLSTLDKGLRRIEEIITTTTTTTLPPSTRKTTTIKGKDAFELNDTFGFPIDLTKLIAAEKGFKVDEEEFEKEMQLQKARSRSASIIDKEDWITVNENGSSKFVGYDSFETESKVLKYRKITSQGKEAYQIVLDKTPFYAESGGQVGDKGELLFPSPNGEGSGVRLEVTDTKKDNDLIVHYTQNLPANISEKLIAKVDAAKRIPTQVHHSATHLMHAALRSVLGKHVAQKGSLVNDEYLRFDFSHFAKVTDEEIAKVEALVNEKIRENIPVVIKQMPKEEAMQTGAMALFGEKYGDVVRVVIIDPDYSIELCGGTHVVSTGELGFFKIKQETAIGAGVRRIEAVSGKAAEHFINEQIHQMHEVKLILKNPKDLSKYITELINDRNQLEKTKEKLERLQAHAALDRLTLKREKINSVDFYQDIIIDVDMGVLKKIFFELEIKNSEEQKGVALLISKKDGKTNVLLGCSDIFLSFDSNKIIKEIISPIINGKGGGQKNLATAVGENGSHLSEVIEKVKSLL